MSESTAADFVADMDAARKEVEKLQQSNASKVEALARLGKGIDLASLANVKIDVFVRTLLDDQAQLVYVRNLEISLRDMLDEALKVSRQEQIVAGAPNSSKGLILPR